MKVYIITQAQVDSLLADNSVEALTERRGRADSDEEFIDDVSLKIRWWMSEVTSSAILPLKEAGKRDDGL